MIVNVNDDLSSEIILDDVDPMLECFLPNYNPETLLPFISEDDVRTFARSIKSNINYFGIKLSDEEKQKNAFDFESKSIRSKRDYILTSVIDQMNPMRYNMLSTDQQTEWNNYRIDLLNVPQQDGFPFNVIWPIQPTL